jgi:diguanylate cyclase (GGDEF)-like protein
MVTYDCLMAGDNAPTLGKVSRRHGNFSATITRTFGAMVFAALLLASAGLYWATHESDTISVGRQARSAHHAMETSVDELALQQETVSIWDDSASHVVAERRDYSWIHDNVGSWLSRIFGHDEVFILDHADQPIYASVKGAVVPLTRYTALSRDLQDLVDSVRGRIKGPNGRHDRNPGQPLGVGNTVRTTQRATHDSHMMLIGGRPAAASAMLIKSSTEGYVRPNGAWPVLVSVRYLDAGFLAELSSRQLIAAPRFSRRPDPRSNEHAVSLHDEGQQLIGYLIWEPELPGTHILSKLLPLNLLILLALVSFMALRGRQLRDAVGELASAEAHAARLAFHDSLTGLPNRALFQQRLDELTLGNTGARHSFALILLDVDDFKLTNDTLGHDAGDAVLVAIAERLKRVIQPKDLVARLGGDEFAILQTHVEHPAQIEELSNEILLCLREPCEHQGKLIHCNASVGGSVFERSASAQSMLKHADLALYEAKSSGRGVFRLYDPGMSSSMLLRREMLLLAEEALEGDFITPFYQPKVHLQTGKVIGFEALLRCCPPGKPMYGPERMAAAFDDSGLATRLSDRMIGGVIKDMLSWRAAGLEFGHVAINAAAAELRAGDFAERLIGKLDEAGIAPKCVQVEVTESVLLGRGVEHVERTFNKLAERGVILALDDFGTGFASLTHLKQYPVQIIKIDRSFVRDLQIDEEDAAIVSALVGLGNALRIEVVAEGIETADQHDFLRALGCAVGQGYHFSAAVCAGSVSDMLVGQPGKQARVAA